MKTALLLIRMAALLTPESLRPEWRREWESEIQNAFRLLQARDEAPRAIQRRLAQFACGAFRDALWHRQEACATESLSESVSGLLRSPGSCLAWLAGLIVLIAAVSGFLPRTRATLLPLPYRDAGRIATVSQAGSMAARVGIRGPTAALWRAQGRLIDGAATYFWGDPASTQARVSPEFFHLLGAKTKDGRDFGTFAGCRACAVVSYDFWRERHEPPWVVVGGREYRVAEVLERRFWFLSPRIAVWMIDPDSENDARRMGVVVRLRPEVDARDGARELGGILATAGVDPWASLVDLSPIRGSVRSVYGSFGFAVVLAIVAMAAILRYRFPGLGRNRRGQGSSCRRGAFFISKALLLLIAVLLCGIEFTPAASLTLLAGAGVTAEPLCTWLFLMASMGVLCWSVLDQRRRCRVCLRRLGLPAHVGCPGCLLLDWAGTELVCREGHGMLHVADMAVCWRETESWTSLDESWRDLFIGETQGWSGL